MAKIKQGILGGFSGKVAGVVGTSWKGRAVMKSRPLSVANPRTDAQQEQRGKFSAIAELASKVLTTFVQPVENPISGDISGYNKFVKDNKEAFNALGKLEKSKFVCGGGKIINLQDFAIEGEVGNDFVAVSWDNASGLSAIRLTDKVYVAAFRADGSLLGVSSGTTTRNTEHIALYFGDEVDTLASGEKVYAIYACVSADGRDVSVLTAAYELSVA